MAHSLLKVGTYDSETMASRGLQRYMQEILPEGVIPVNRFNFLLTRIPLNSLLILEFAKGNLLFSRLCV